MSDPKPLTPAEARRLWVEALRSGEYEQGRTWLRENDRYCCLGVACELYRKHTGIGRWESNCFDSGSGAKSQYVSDEVKRWLGMTTHLGAYGDYSNLASTNDGGMSFSQIADLIESNPPGLFVEEHPDG